MEPGRSFLGHTPPLPVPPLPASKLRGHVRFRQLPGALLRSLEPRVEAWPQLLKTDTSQCMTLEKDSDAEDGDQLGPNFQRICSLSWASRLALNLNGLGMDERPSSDEVEIAEVALTASEDAAASLAEGASAVDIFGSSRSVSSSSSSSMHDEVITVRSTKRLQRESVRRKVASRDTDSYTKTKNKPRKAVRVSQQNGPIRNFLGGCETKRLLTKVEECKLAEDVQELKRLEEVKNMFELKFGRQPTLPEWAEYVGLSCNTLSHRLHCGCRSRERLVHFNMRVVVHIAKHYEGQGLSLPDLLQAGSQGLMKGVERFKPHAGCRFASYAYWWVRQSIQQAIQRHSRIIYLPEHVYKLLKNVKNVKKSCFQEGNHHPTNDEIARRVGITPQKLTKLLHTTRLPKSMNRNLRSDSNLTYQDVIADPRKEDPLIAFAEQTMELHLLELVNGLPPKERSVMWLRYGLEGGKPSTLAETGRILGLTKERVRVLQNGAMEKIKQSIPPEDKRAFVALVTKKL